MHSTLDFWLYDNSNLCAVHKVAMQMLESVATLLNPQPTGNFSGIKMYTLESEIDHEKINQH